MGIGLAIVDRLVDEWSVVAVDIAPMDEITAKYGHTVAIVNGSVTEEATMNAAREAAEAMAPLEGWVNNAGRVQMDHIHESDVATYEAIVDVNIKGTWLGCREAIRAMLARKRGAIVNISSIHARRGFPGWATYDATKGAIDSLTRQLAAEYGPEGIRVNVVAPGAIWTPNHERLRAAAPDVAEFDRVLETTPPLRRVGRPEEIADAVAFMLSDASRFVTGESLAVDGGWTCG